MTPLSKTTAYRIEAMESARLVWYKHHIPWADQIISSLDKPPEWVVDLSTLEYIGDVQKALRTYIFSEPFEQLDDERYYRDYLASLLLRYRRRELSWASFLDLAGRYTDSSQRGEHPCEFFFEMLNELEDSDFDLTVENEQRQQIEHEFEAAVEDLLPLYNEFLRFYPNPTNRSVHHITK